MGSYRPGLPTVASFRDLTVTEDLAVHGTITFDGTLANISNILIPGVLAHQGLQAGFFNAPFIAQPTGVAVDIAAVHAALVALGLIAP